MKHSMPTTRCRKYMTQIRARRWWWIFTRIHGIYSSHTHIKRQVAVESGKKVEWTAEENYKFKLSAFQEPLLKWIEANPDGKQLSYYQQIQVVGSYLDYTMSSNCTIQPAQRSYLVDQRWSRGSVRIPPTLKVGLGHPSAERSRAYHLCLAGCTDKLHDCNWVSMGTWPKNRMASWCPRRWKRYRTVRIFM